MSYIVISILEYYINILDSNNFKMIERFLNSDLFSNLLMLVEVLKNIENFYSNLFFVIFQNLSKPNPKLSLLELLFKKERIIKIFINLIMNFENNSVFRLNFLIILETLISEIRKTINKDNLEEYLIICPTFLGYLNELNDIFITK